jgi:hypothetical protein
MFVLLICVSVDWIKVTQENPDLGVCECGSEYFVYLRNRTFLEKGFSCYIVNIKFLVF